MPVKRFVDQTEFHRLARHRLADGVGVTSDAGTAVGESGARTIRFVMSDGSRDRAGDTIDPRGWSLTAFQKNPVALFGHDSSSPPIGRWRGVHSDGSRLVGDLEFMSADISPFADSIYRMARAGYVKAVSVGFLPIEYKLRSDGIDFKRQELLECSVCSVGANSNALIAARLGGARHLPRLDARAQRIAEAKRIRIESAALCAGMSASEAKTYARRKARNPVGGPPPGFCGRARGAPCGLKDESMCQRHCSPPATCSGLAWEDCQFEDAGDCTTHASGSPAPPPGPPGPPVA
jgi:HK97 family phage prohead protease